MAFISRKFERHKYTYGRCNNFIIKYNRYSNIIYKHAILEVLEPIGSEHYYSRILTLQRKIHLFAIVVSFIIDSLIVTVYVHILACAGSYCTVTL